MIRIAFTNWLRSLRAGSECVCCSAMREIELRFTTLMERGGLYCPHCEDTCGIEVDLAVETPNNMGILRRRLCPFCDEDL